MKRFFAIQLFILIGLSLSAQSWFPIGATWHYSQVHIDTNTGFYYNSFHKMEVTKDTVLLGQDCNTVDRSSGTCDLLPLQLFIREEAGVVLLLNETMTAFDTLIDMNKNIGEHWTIQPINSISTDSIVITVVGKGFKIINSDTLNALQVTISSNEWEWTATDSIIEKIGFYPGYFFPQYYLCDNRTGGLRCYQDHNIGLFETGSTSFCEEEIGAGISEPDFNNSISPNPASNSISFNLNKESRYSIKIINLSGTTVMNTEMMGGGKRIIDISSLSQGIYFIEAVGENIFIGRFVKE